MRDGPVVFANIAAEEGDWRTLARLPAVRGVAQLFEALLTAAFPDLPAPFAETGLPRAGQLAAWLNTEEAAQVARERGLVLYGAAPETVRRVHDKAFALHVARAEQLEPPALQGVAGVLQECVDV